VLFGFYVIAIGFEGVNCTTPVLVEPFPKRMINRNCQAIQPLLNETMSSLSLMSSVSSPSIIDDTLQIAYCGCNIGFGGAMCNISCSLKCNGGSSSSDVFNNSTDPASERSLRLVKGHCIYNGNAHLMLTIGTVEEQEEQTARAYNDNDEDVSSKFQCACQLGNFGVNCEHSVTLAAHLFNYFNATVVFLLYVILFITHVPFWLYRAIRSNAKRTLPYTLISVFIIVAAALCKIVYHILFAIELFSNEGTFAHLIPSTFLL